MTHHRTFTLAVLCALVALAGGATAAPSAQAAASPHWLMLSQAAPTDFHPGDTSDFYEVIAVNDGAASTTEPTTITDTLPPGVIVNKVVGPLSNGEPAGGSCTQAESNGSVTLTCTLPGAVPAQGAGSTYQQESGVVSLTINVQVPLGTSGPLLNQASVSGGGAPRATASNETPVTRESEPVPFGVSAATDATGLGGVERQAGSHPFALTTMLAFNVGSVNPFEHCHRNTTPSCADLNAQAKDVEVALPPGFVGNPTAVPYCKQSQFEQHTSGGCPPATQVGSIRLYFYGEGTHPQYSPVYNIEPPPGQPGELGFTVGVAHVPIFFHVRSDGDYGLTADVTNITQYEPVWMTLLTIWGNPADPAHHNERVSIYETCSISDGGCESPVLEPKPFLTMPTSCSSEPLSVPVAGDSWQQPLQPAPILTAASLGGMTGCEALRFSPSISLKPSTHQAGAPVGYDVGVNVPQNEELEGLATPAVRNVEVTLPEGTVLSPSAANGLEACSEAMFALKTRAKGACPSGSKIGTVQITTPLLAQPVKGTVYAGEPECSPCSPAAAQSGAMVRVLIEAEGSGVIIKLAGHTRINQSTGQLTTVFTDNPQLPFSELVLSLEPGPGAPLVNPSTCGPATATAAITPWSDPTPVDTATTTEIEGCAPQSQNPAFVAGTTTSSHGGAYTGLHVSLTRQDNEQTFGRLSVTTPPGLLGTLKGVAQCGEAQANTGTCPASSQIGSGWLLAGPGPSPLVVSGSKVYLTGPYGGQPFGLSIVTPAQAGPFLLSGNTGNGSEVVRASIHIDPSTSALTVTSDPLPQALDGIPLNLRAINIDIDRPAFMFSPTSCNATAITATVAAPGGSAKALSYPFQSTDCALLPFKPRFTAATIGHAGRRTGTSLDVRVASNGGPQQGGGEANIAKVKVSLPKALPSRNLTLQKACVAAVFQTNPAACPRASMVGAASVSTPLLAKPLAGPAILVSHAGLAFPDLDIVLQGEGVTLTLVGNTFISRAGVTTSTFNAVPDAPISSFELKLPTGPYSLLTAYVSGKAQYNLCSQTLKMPTTITAQNGAVITQTTRIATTGCPKAKKAKSARRHVASRGRRSA